MTFVVFVELALPGTGGAAIPSQPFLDASGSPVPQPDDGPFSAALTLEAVCAGVMQSPQDPGRMVFDGNGFQCSATMSASRIVLTAGPTAGPRWAGQVCYRWISDILVRPRTGRRDNGGVRIQFIDPSQPLGFLGRHYVDLLMPRKITPATFAWDLLQRTTSDRQRRMSPPGDHQVLNELLAAGPLGPKASARYAIPGPSVAGGDDGWPVDPAGETLRIPVGPLVDLQPGGPGGRLSPRDSDETVLGWSAPPTLEVDPPDAAQTRLRPTPSAPGPAPAPGSGPTMIVAVPGVGRHAGPAADQPVIPPSPAPSRVGDGFHRVEMDSGETVVVDLPTLFGRDPAADAGEDVLVHAVADVSLSFSKTHLLLAPTTGGISVTDRHSTNGVLIRRSGQLTACAPGVPQLLELPATLQIGTRTMIVTQG